jgi:hypothetical protein
MELAADIGVKFCAAPAGGDLFEQDFNLLDCRGKTANVSRKGLLIPFFQNIKEFHGQK